MLLPSNVKHSAAASPFVSTLNFWKMKLSAGEQAKWVMIHTNCWLPHGCAPSSCQQN